MYLKPFLTEVNLRSPISEQLLDSLITVTEKTLSINTIVYEEK